MTTDNKTAEKEIYMSKTEELARGLPMYIDSIAGINQKPKRFWLTIRPAKTEFGEEGRWAVYYRRHRDNRPCKSIPICFGTDIARALTEMKHYLAKHSPSPQPL